ncbi:hypothetical protein BDN67DRAFT_959285 [Paxillus ammoniavirescens]|nr:hypothetical protein BDN67DRAFT_959285 [Paxillus ammoniavirescens]
MSPFLQHPAFTAGIVLSFNICGGKRSGLSIDFEKEVTDVRKCLSVLKRLEKRYAFLCHDQRPTCTTVTSYCTCHVLWRLKSQSCLCLECCRPPISFKLSYPTPPDVHVGICWSYSCGTDSLNQLHTTGERLGLHPLNWYIPKVDPQRNTGTPIYLFLCHLDRSPTRTRCTRTSRPSRHDTCQYQCVCY